MSQKTTFDTSISRTANRIGQQVKQLHPKAFAIKERHHVMMKTDTLNGSVDVGYVRSDICNILALLDNNYSIDRKSGFEWPMTPSDLKYQWKLKMNMK